jgi:hypothetical protein
VRPCAAMFPERNAIMGTAVSAANIEAKALKGEKLTREQLRQLSEI